MVVRFTWESEERREAHLLCSTERARTVEPIPMGYIVPAVMLTGGAGDLLHLLLRSHGAVMRDRLVPVLLAVVSSALLLMVWSAVVRSRKRYRVTSSAPEGVQQIAFCELGWNASTSTEVTGREQMRPWSEFHGHRTGRAVIAFQTKDGNTLGVPLRALTTNQESWLECLMERKARTMH